MEVANMPKTVEKFICCLCGEPINSTQFYKSYSSFYYGGHLPICKDCFSRKFRQYALEYHSNKKAMQRMCMAFDIYFDEDLFDKCDTNDETVIGNYFKRLNIKQHKGKTFDKTIENGEFSLSGDRKRVNGKRVAYVDEYDNVQEETTEEKINPKDIEKWGIGYDSIDYDTLNTHYKYLKNANPNCDSNQEIFVTNLCYIYMKQMKALREGDTKSFTDLAGLYMKTFKEAGLKTVKDTSESKDFVAGVTASIIEKYTPTEFYKNQKLYRDFDGLGGIIKRFFTRPLKNLQFGTNEQDEEYSIQDGEDDEQ
jgi:hypothetical protein